MDSSGARQKGEEGCLTLSRYLILKDRRVPAILYFVAVKNLWNFRGKFPLFFVRESFEGVVKNAGEFSIAE